MELIAVPLMAASALAGLPVLILSVEVAAAIFARDPSADGSAVNSNCLRQCSLAVVIPAHNETTGIIPTIEDVRSQLHPGDRLVVVADNCTDDTALVAASAGAEVVQRNEPSRIGKGFALACAIRHLSVSPPDFVLFVDADCRIADDAIAKLVGACRDRERPIQAAFLMKEASRSPIDHGFTEFAFLVRSWVRPLGLAALNLPTQLMGTGMIFPWNVIHSAPLASDHLVEDLKLGLDLAASGNAPGFLPQTIVTSEFPTTLGGADSQRERWIQGQFLVLARIAPSLLLTAIRRRNMNLLALTLDTMVPPLILLAFINLGLFVLSAFLAVFGASYVALIISTSMLALLAAALLASWYRFGRSVLPPRKMLNVAPIVRRIRLLAKILTGRASKQWVRAERGAPSK